MKKIIPLIIALSLAGLGGASANGTIFKTINIAEMTTGWISVNDLQSDGGAFQFGGAWPVADLVATFPTATSVTLSPITISTNDTFWYAQPGNIGNKEVKSFLMAVAPRSSLNGDILSFQADVASYSLGTNAAGNPYTVQALIQEFVPGGGYNSTALPITSPSSFELLMPLNENPETSVQWGFIFTGPNIWPGNIEELANAGSVTIQAIPEPSTYALLGLAAAGGLLVRRLRRKA